MLRLERTILHRHRLTNRWQDVLQILDAGISLISAVNIQHIEGVNEEVSDISKNIDLTVDELIARLKAGKIYARDKIPIALQNFFREENILQLRGLALKEVALRVEKKVKSEVSTTAWA